MVNGLQPDGKDPECQAHSRAVRPLVRSRGIAICGSTSIAEIVGAPANTVKTGRSTRTSACKWTHSLRWTGKPASGGGRARKVGSHAATLPRIPSRPAVSATQRAWWHAAGGVRRRNALLPMVYNCHRSIVANDLYPHAPDHHSTGPPIFAWLPCTSFRKSSPPRVAYGSACGERRRARIFRILQIARF